MAWARKMTTADGKVRWRAEYRDQTRRIRSAGTFPREKDAKLAAAGQEVAKAKGTWTDPALGRMALRDWYPRFLQARAGDHSASTRAWYESMWRHIDRETGHRQIGSISRLDVEAFEARVREDRGPAAARAARRGLASILQAAEDAGVIARNPARGIRSSRPATEPMRFLSHQELAEVAAEVPHRDRALVLLLGLAGLRIGESLALRVEDLDLLRRRVTVTKAAAEVRGKVTIGPTKTGKARAVPIPAVVAEALADHLSAFPAAPDGLVFPDRDGGPMRRTNWRRRVWLPAVRRARIVAPVPRVHDLRHTAASLAIHAGAHPKAIQEMLGHSSITVTLDRYGHLFPSLAEQLAERLDAAFRDASPIRRPGEPSRAQLQP